MHSVEISILKYVLNPREKGLKSRVLPTNSERKSFGNRYFDCMAVVICEVIFLAVSFPFLSLIATLDRPPSSCSVKSKVIVYMLRPLNMLIRFQWEGGLNILNWSNRIGQTVDGRNNINLLEFWIFEFVVFPAHPMLFMLSIFQKCWNGKSSSNVICSYEGKQQLCCHGYVAALYHRHYCWAKRSCATPENSGRQNYNFSTFVRMN